MTKTPTETTDAAAQKVRAASTLDAIERRFAIADVRGSLARRVRDVVLDNRHKAAKA